MRGPFTRSLVRAAATAGLALLAAGAAAAPVQAQAPRFMPGEVVVRYEPGTGASERAGVRRQLDADLEHRLAIARAELLDLASGDSVRAAVAELEAQPEVLYAEPNFVYRLENTPNDPLFSQLWGLKNSGQLINGSGGSLLDADIDAPEAWDETTGLSSVVIGVVDSGVLMNHEDLDGNLWINPDESGSGMETDGLDNDGNSLEDDVNGWDWVGDDPGDPEDAENDPTDSDGHGTHVAGTIAAEGANGTGITGVNWAASLMPLRVCSLNGCTSADIASAFAYAGGEGADVVNASLSGAGSSTLISDALDAAPDTLFVVAAGNDASNNDVLPRSPCNDTAPNLVCVAASGRTDNLASFSNFGDDTVDLAAPGVTTDSTYPFVDRANVNFASTMNPPIGPLWTAGGAPDSWERTTEATQLTNSTLTDSESGDYEDDTDNHATYGPVDLSADSGCHLRYDLERDLGDGDMLQVETSTDDISYLPIDTAFGVQGKDVRSADLTSVSGNTQVWIRFRLIADSANTGDGVHIDNVRIRCPKTDLYGFMQGTSMATPHVAGGAALLISSNPAASVAEVRSWLLDGVDPKTSLEGLLATGGRLNLERSMAGAGGADIRRPETTIGSGPDDAGTRGPATFTFDADEPGSFRCSLDGGGVAPCASPTTYSGLARGFHSFSVHAVDAAGNSDPTRATRSFRIAQTQRCLTLKRKLRRATSLERKRTLHRKMRRACRTF